MSPLLNNIITEEEDKLRYSSESNNEGRCKVLEVEDICPECTLVFDSVDVDTENPAIAVTASVASHVLCNGGSDGSATGSASGGSGTYTSYSWEKDGTVASTVQNPTDLSAGTYTLTVTDSAGAIGISSEITISQPDALSTTSTKTDVAIAGESTGAIDLTVSGGTAPYTYLWNDGVTTANRTGLAAGTYTVTVTDDNGCTDTHSVAINNPVCDLAINSVDVNTENSDIEVVEVEEEEEEDIGESIINAGLSLSFNASHLGPNPLSMQNMTSVTPTGTNLAEGTVYAQTYQGRGTVNWRITADGDFNLHVPVPGVSKGAWGYSYGAFNVYWTNWLEDFQNGTASTNSTPWGPNTVFTSSYSRASVTLS